jgi:transcriptional antiterminator Rof (Rho-off)
MLPVKSIDWRLMIPHHLSSTIHLKAGQRRLAAQYSLPIRDRDSQLVAALEGETNALEKDLVRTVNGFGEAVRQLNWQEVRDILRSDEAAIEFVRYRYYDAMARVTDSTMYAVLLLLPGVSSPYLIPLCEERQLEATIPERKGPIFEYLATPLYAGSRIDDSPSLYDLVWAPRRKKS